MSGPETTLFSKTPAVQAGETEDIFDLSGTFRPTNTPGPTRIPEKIGPYLVLKPLGKGGMSRVYLAEHLAMKRLVALKVLPDHLARDPGAVERFYREARAAAALDHPNIVRAYDICAANGFHCLVMEYVPGRDLAAVLREKGPMPVHEAVACAIKAATGLQHAYEKGVVHRDIKPSNLLIDDSGAVKILDMGLARFQSDGDDRLTDEFDDSAVYCTPDYVAPEQVAKGIEADTRADIYALGGTLYTLLSGKPPFSGSVAQKLVFQQARDPVPLHQVRPAVPRELSAVVARMMAKDRAKRYQTPAKVIAALEPWARPRVAAPVDGSAETRKLFASSWAAITDPDVQVVSPRGSKVWSVPAQSHRARRAAVVAGALTAALITAVLVGVRGLPRDLKPNGSAVNEPTRSSTPAQRVP